MEIHLSIFDLVNLAGGLTFITVFFGGVWLKVFKPAGIKLFPH